jgi:hypothetical protein
MRKITILSISFIVLGILLFVYRMFNKPHTDVLNTKATVEMTAIELFTYFDTNEDSATIKYSDQIIVVSGVLHSKDLSNELEPQILIKTNEDDGFIRCGFKPEYLNNINSLKESSTIKVKGICKGLNGDDDLELLSDKDVVLSSSILIE